MTAATDPARDLIAALPRNVRAQLHVTQTVTGMVHAAIRDHGWTVTQLAAECNRDLDGVANAGALVTYRLRHAAGHPPPTRTGLAVVPLCGSCVDGFLLDPGSLLPIARCPCRTATKEGA
jgi:hypothetical protein